MIHRLSRARQSSGNLMTRSRKAERRAVSPAARADRTFKPNVLSLEEKRVLLLASITGLGNPPYSTKFSPAALNDSDQIIGSDDSANQYLYSGGSWTEYPILGNGFAIPSYICINDSGVVAGSYSISTTIGLRYADGKATPLPPDDVNPYVPGGGLFYGGSTVSSMNNAGDAVGESAGYKIETPSDQPVGPSQQYATLWPAGEQNPDLPAAYRNRASRWGSTIAAR